MKSEKVKVKQHNMTSQYESYFFIFDTKPVTMLYYLNSNEKTTLTIDLSRRLILLLCKMISFGQTV